MNMANKVVWQAINIHIYSIKTTSPVQGIMNPVSHLKVLYKFVQVAIYIQTCVEIYRHFPHWNYSTVFNERK